MSDDRYQTMNENEIFAEIGRFLLEDSLGSMKLSPEESEEVGRNWFSSIKKNLRRPICGNKLIMNQLFLEGPALRNAIIVALTDAALHTVFLPVPIVAVSHAVICYGIQALCAEKDDTDEQ